MLYRRDILAAFGGAALAGGARADMATLPFSNGARPLVAMPGKRPLLLLTQRPPQLETPFALFDEAVITPNDAFFVRYSMANLPLDLVPADYRLVVAGTVARPLSLSLADLARLPQQSITAVNQCSGNSRGFVSPRVGGGQMGHGAMGNARWTGVPLAAVLERAGVNPGATTLLFEGLDSPASPTSPEFAKSLTVEHAMAGDVLLATRMNGAPLPFLNGYPLRLVVPGWFGTYWVKHLDRITLLDRPFDGYFMKGTYRMPANACGCVEPGTKPAATVPIERMRVRSFLTNLADGATVAAGTQALRGIAFDGGSGIRRVLVSTDGGAGWTEARLGPDLGPYSFRSWTHAAKLVRGPARIQVRAESSSGEWQPLSSSWNPSGYASNGVLTTQVTAA